MIGKTISHYKIIEKLGEGGMGVVYKAEDTKLKRTVALKFLPPEMTRDPEAKARFIREAQAASTLEHNNICNIHEIDETDDGQLFIAMACYEGQTLKQKIEQGPLKIDKAINISIQISQGLAKAHEQNIIHRDIKPANILLTKDSVAKIVDFGLAKLSGRTKVTVEGTTLGTVSYMSPEQIRGQEIDHRTDIWSLGVMLYEMITGQLPFKGEYDQAVMYSIVNEEPDPPTALRSGMSMEMERIINKILAKNPNERYQHMDDLIVDLRSLIETDQSESLNTHQTRKPAFSKKRNYLYPVIISFLVIAAVILFYILGRPNQKIDSIAILPFENTSRDPKLEYLCEGIPDNITNCLSRLSELKVISSSSVRHYKGEGLDLKKVAKELNIRAVLIGKLNHSGKILSIRVELVDMRDQRQLWGNEYTPEFTEILQIQKDMVTKISGQLLSKISADEQRQLVKEHTEITQAYQFYILGTYHWNRYTDDDQLKAVEYYERAIELDPNYALAHVGLSYAYNLWGSHHGGHSSVEMGTKAREAALQALELDATLGEAYGALALVMFFHDWNWSAAEEAFIKGIRLNPNSAMVHGHYALLLDALGRTAEAIAERKLALELDPLSLKFQDDQAMSLMDLGRDDEALKLWRTVLDMDSTFAPSRRWVGRILLKIGNYEAAIKEFRKGVKFSGRQHMYLGYLGWALATVGQHQEAREILNELIQNRQELEINAYSIAMIYVGLGDQDSTFEWLEKAYIAHLTEMIFLKIDPIFDTVQFDPRFQTLMSKMGL